MNDTYQNSFENQYAYLMYDTNYIENYQIRIYPYVS